MKDETRYILVTKKIQRNTYYKEKYYKISIKFN